ncbi:hypothetical protein ABBQ38_005894 [Trebouxia sp. C0009 RCD-2024]
MLLISEWWASETAVMMGGLLPDAQRQLSAMAIYQTTNAMCFMLPLGIAVAVSTRNQWGALFSTDPELAALIAQTLTVLAFYIVLDGLSVVLGGVIRGAGKQLLASPCVIVSYYALGLPAAAFFAFKCGLGVRGLCLGTLLGTAVHAGSFYFLVWQLDWNLEAHRAAARVKGSKLVALQTILTSNACTTDDRLAETQEEFSSAESGDLPFNRVPGEEEDEGAGLLAGVVADSVLCVDTGHIADDVVSNSHTVLEQKSIH